MSGKERFLAVVQGHHVDSRASVGLVDEPGNFDARLTNSVVDDSSGSAILLAVQNPFGFARCDDVDLNQVLKRDPDSGLLDRYAAQTAASIQSALQSADCVFYVLDGAYPAASTPMQYGGYYLEKDRELLTEAISRIPVVLFIAGSDSPYLDFVSDLPCSVFAWDSEKTGISSAQVRALRHGVQASADPDSELKLSVGASESCMSSKEILHV